MTIKGLVVEHVLVVPTAEIASESYVGSSWTGRPSVRGDGEPGGRS